jgi:hypothetical protein
MRIALELHAYLVIKDPKISVPTTDDRIRYYRLYFLRQNAYIRLVITEITEAVKAQAVAEMAEESDVVLEQRIGPSPAASRTSAAASAHAAATASPGNGNTSAPGACATTKARAPALGLQISRPAGLHVPKGISAPRTVSTRCGIVRCLWPVPWGSLVRCLWPASTRCRLIPRL